MVRTPTPDAPCESWIDRVAAGYGEMKERFMQHCICYAQALDEGSFDDDASDGEDDIDWDLTDGGGQWINSEYPPIAFVRDTSQRKLLPARSNRRIESENTFTNEQTARALSQECSTANDDEHIVQDEKLDAALKKPQSFRDLSQALTALRFMLTMKKQTHIRKHQSAFVIQRCWRRYNRHCRHRTQHTMVAASSRPLPFSKKSLSFQVVSSPVQSSRYVPRCSKSFGMKAVELADLEWESKSADHDGFLATLLQQNELFNILSACTSPAMLPQFFNTSERFSACTQRKAACVIQSAWRCVVAKQEARALRRLCAYEEESQSAMPTIRSQMNLVRQRLLELQTREIQIIDFDDEWL